MTLSQLRQVHNSEVNRKEPFFTLSVREEGPWLQIAASNDFILFAQSVMDILEKLKDSGFKVLIERLIQDEDDDCLYKSTTLVQKTL